MSKKIMRAFKINEISVVDNPAQAGARHIISKRVEPIIKNQNPEENAMTPEEIAALKKKADDGDAATAALAKANTDLAKVGLELAKAKKEADMTPEEKKKYQGMNDVDKAAWLEKSSADRQAVLRNDNDSNAIVYKSESTGLEFRKNDDSRLVIMAKAADDSAKVAKATQEKLENSELQKRADEILKNSPGTIEERSALLKAAESISDEAVRKKAIESLKAGDAALAKAFTKAGSTGGSDGGDKGAEGQLDALAKKYAADNKVNYYKAYDEVIKTAEGNELYKATKK